MKRVIQLAIIVAAAKVAYEVVRRQNAAAPLPAGAPYEPAPVPVPVARAGPVDIDTSDDLTAIRGIGPVFAQRLADLGLSNFSALGGADADNVARQLGVSVAVFTAWQDQARGI